MEKVKCNCGADLAFSETKDGSGIYSEVRSVRSFLVGCPVCGAVYARNTIQNREAELKNSSNNVVKKSKVEQVIVDLHAPNLDKASRVAYERAGTCFGIDDSGNAADPDFPRSSSCLIVKFSEYKIIAGMTGQTYLYTFDTWMEVIDDVNN